MRLLFLLSSVSYAFGQHCATYNHTGVDYADRNISVTVGAANSQDCCEACATYNAKRTAGAPRCNVAVWWRDALNFTGLCCLKETAKLPVERKLTASVVAPPTPAPVPPFRFAAMCTDNMVLQASPARAQVWGFVVRILVTMHMAWLVNSAVHIWGKQVPSRPLPPTHPQAHER